MIIENNVKKIDSIISNRTKYLTVAVEDVYQSQNASTILRTCESLGIVNVHVIETRNSFSVDTNISLGAENSLEIFRYSNSLECIKKLKEQGYKIIATTPHKNDFNLENLPINQKMAIFFGTEEKGLSKEVIDNADQFMKIPMFGFTESLNISVSLAVTLYYLVHKLHDSDVDWELTNEEQNILREKYLIK